MNRLFKSLIFVLIFAYNSTALSAGAWYVGKVDRVALTSNDGSFLVTFENGALLDCNHEYAYFFVSELGIDRVKNAFSIALTSLSASKNMGVVIDKSINGVGGNCLAEGMTADLRK